eukprot:m.505117 g.505117  ORF g.505117 m.505117 type:complete len:109 (+) comp57362_c0_seq60:1242-1568(+)
MPSLSVIRSSLSIICLEQALAFQLLALGCRLWGHRFCSLYHVLGRQREARITLAALIVGTIVLVAGFAALELITRSQKAGKKIFVLVVGLLQLIITLVAIGGLIKMLD